MILFAAVDLFDGKVVRLTQGDFDRRANYDVTPEEVAKKYKDTGCSYIHIVDLQGAKEGKPCHLPVLEKLSKMGMFVQYGGGLRSEESIRLAEEAGADRIMVGSLLFTDKEAPQRIFDLFGTVVMPSVDVKAGKVVHSGWLKGTDSTPLEELDKLTAIGYQTFLVTDTERDGSMSGTRAELYTPLVNEKRNIVAAGGITTADDLRLLASLGVNAAIIGKSLYEGGITLEEALTAAKGN